MKSSPLLFLGVCLALVIVEGSVQAGPRERAIRIYNRLAGVTIAADDTRLKALVDAGTNGTPNVAAQIATSDDHFYDLTVRRWATEMDGRTPTPEGPLNDFVATLVGSVRDEIDARTLLTGDFKYVGDPDLDIPAVSAADNRHFEAMDAKQLGLRASLVKQSPQWTGMPEAAGLLTTRAWSAAQYSGGTNRRAIDFSFRAFLCSSVKEQSNSNLPDDWVRRDVDRTPGGSARTFQTTCRGCHAGMDALGPAFGRLDFVDNRLVFSPKKLQAKMLRNSDTFPQGRAYLDDSWINFWTVGTGQTIGWRGATDGKGVHEYGAMIAESKAFSACMVKRVFKTVCRRPASSGDAKLMAKLSASFEADKYNLKHLFQNVAVEETCIEE